MSVFYQGGLHAGECVGQWLDAPQGKSPYFALKFNILARIVNNEEHRVEPGERTVYLYLTDKAIEMASDVLAHLGYDKDNLRFLDPNKPDHYSFIGKRCDLWCKHEEYQGEMREKWSVSMPFSDPTPLDDKEMRRLDTLFGKAMKTRKPAGAAAPSPPKPELVGVSESQRNAAPKSSPERAPTGDDIPF